MLEFLDRILNAETADDVWALQTDAIESFGFDRLIYGFTRYMTETGFGCPDDCLILSNHEPEYVQRYIGDGLYAHAPMLHWAARSGPLRLVESLPTPRNPPRKSMREGGWNIVVYHTSSTTLFS